MSRGILKTFCGLSFISSKFGALAAEGGGFAEMKRAFFGALDVLSSNSDDQDTTGDRLCSKLIKDLATELAGSFFVDLILLTSSLTPLSIDVERSLGVAHPIYQGRVIYFLVCTEHVMSQLEEETISQVVLPVVQKSVCYATRNLLYTNAWHAIGTSLTLKIVKSTRQHIRQC